MRPAARDLVSTATGREGKRTDSRWSHQSIIDQRRAQPPSWIFFSPSLLYTLSSFGTSIGGDVIRHDNYPSYFQLTLSTLLRRSQSLSGIRGSTDMGEHGTLIKNHLRFGTWQLTLVPFESLLWRRSSSWYLSIWYMCWNGIRACGCHAEYVKMTIVLAATLFVSLYECSATVPQLLQWTRKTR